MADTRERMIDAAIGALRRDGVAGMSFTDVLAESGAARGAIYHHFPGGKSQLVAEAARRHAGDVRDALAALPASSPSVVVDAFLGAVGPVLADSAAGSSCALAAVGLGAAELRGAADAGFASWTEVLADRLTTAGLDDGAARDLAVTLIALLEGAHVLCRAAGGIEPYERLLRTARDLVAARYP